MASVRWHPATRTRQMASLKDMRERNRTRLLLALRQAGETDRAALVESTGLSRATVSSLVGDALARGHLIEAHPPGRRPAILRLDPRAGLIAGVDFGHSHVRVVVADLTGDVVAERRVGLDVDAAGHGALAAAAGLVEEAVRSAEVDRGRLLGVGLGIPGPVDRETGTVRSASILAGWVGVRPETELGTHLRLPVRVENDANLGALGEHVHGAARGAADVIYVKVSTGVGAGVLVDGSIYTGARGVAGEIGHVPVVAHGSICRCGNRGCLETVASAGAVARALAPVDRNVKSFRHLLELVSEDRAAENVLTDVGRHVGRALAPVCAALEIQLVVVGGELGGVSQRLVDALEDELRRMFAAREPIAVRPAALGDRAEALGAVALALDQHAWLSGAGLIALNDERQVERAMEPA